MKKIAFLLGSLFIFLVILSIFSYQHIYGKQEPKNKDNEINEKVINMEEGKKESEINEPITEDIKTIDNDDSNSIEANDNSNSSDFQNSLESNNVSNSNVIKNESKKVEEKKTVSQEIKKTEQPPAIKVEEPKVEEVRDDIVDTNSFFYSIHQGNIDTYSQNNCLSAGNEIAFLDTVDINYYRCYEVTSTTGKVLGYYLNIFCESGNCNRYKSQIDMSKYR